MIFRTVKNKNYVSIHTGFLNDKNLSFRAKGLMAYCLSRVDDWEFHISHLATVSKEGRDSTYAAVKELIQHGYIVRQLSRNKGKFEKGFYEIHEVPQVQEQPIKPEQQPVTGNPEAVEPHTEKPYTVFPDPANPQLISIDRVTSIEESNKTPYPLKGESANAEVGGSSFSSKRKKEKKPVIEKLQVKDNVLLSQSEIDTLKQEFSSDDLIELVTILSNYKHSSGKTYKSDYHAIIGWVKDRFHEKKAKVIPKGKLALSTDGVIDSPDAQWRRKEL
jgi:predicted lipase